MSTPPPIPGPPWQNPPPPPVQPLPYATPQPHVRGVCPRCGQAAVQPVKWTWWGGLLGPKMLSHAKCHACRYQFNSRTGRSNTTAITIYLVVSAIIGIVGGAMIVLAMG